MSPTASVVAFGFVWSSQLSLIHTQVGATLNNSRRSKGSKENARRCDGLMPFWLRRSRSPKRSSTVPIRDLRVAIFLAPPVRPSSAAIAASPDSRLFRDLTKTYIRNYKSLFSISPQN